MMEITKEKALILLCPKTTFALLGTQKATLQKYPLSGSMKYGEACKEVVGKIAIVGETCIKNTGYQMDGGFIREVVIA